MGQKGKEKGVGIGKLEDKGLVLGWAGQGRVAPKLPSSWLRNV